MGPSRNKFWLPLARLGGFFLLVVVTGNVVLNRFPAAPPASAAPSDPDDDYFGRKKRQLERHYRAFERFFGLQEPSPASGVRPVEVEPLSQVEEEVWTVSFDAAGLEFDAPEFEVLAPPDPPVLSEPVLAARPISLLLEERPEFPGMTPELVAEWSRSIESPWWRGVGDGLLGLPELVLDGVWWAAREVVPRSRRTVWREGDEESITSRLLDFNVEPRRESIFSEFLGHLADRERRFFARFEDSHLHSAGFEDGTAAMDLDGLKDEQRKVLWDALRKTYFSKYKVRAEERIRDDAFYFNDWRGLDFAVLPPLIAGYVYYRGLEKRISVGGTWLRLSFEPLSKWIDSDEDRVAGASIEWAPKGSPVGLIVSAGLYEGKVEMDFIGIGTSASMARKLLFTQQREEEVRPERY